MRSNATPVRVERILLHIGTEKTGTSSIQHFLSRNRAALAAEGFVYPQFTGANGGSQWGVVAAVLKRPWKTEIGVRLGIRDEGSADSYRQQLLEAFDDELLACPGRHTLILSSEHFHSRLRAPARLQALKHLLARWSDNAHILVYFRRQDRVAISHYSTRLKSGQAEPRVFRPVTDNPLPYYYDYERIYTNWSRVFGEDAVQAGLFAPQHLAGGDLLTDFCRRVGITEKGKTRPPRINESLSETGVQLMLELNRQWPKQPLSDPNPSREQLVANIAREHPGRNFPATRTQAQAFYAHFTASNARLAREVFPELEGPIFDEDFSDYPEVLTPPQEDLSGEIRSRIRAWRAASAAEQLIGIGRLMLSARQLLGGAAARFQSLRASVGRARTQTPAVPPDAGLPPVFLHLGLPKTATTTLQNTLFCQHPGICYLGKRRTWEKTQEREKGCASNEIYRALRPVFWDREESTDPARVRAVLQEYSRANGPQKPILGSWEGLLIKPPEAFQAMLREARNLLGDVRVVVTLRNPLKRLPSAYLHAMKACTRHGRHHTMPEGRVFVSFDEWLKGAPRDPKAHDSRFDFGDNLRFAVELLGRDKVGVFLLEDMIEDRDAFVTSLLDFMGIDNGGAELVGDQHLNPAFNAAQLAFLKSIDESPEQRERWLALSRPERESQMEKIAEDSPGDKYNIVLSDDQRELIEARSRDLDRWLVDTFGLDLERHGYPL